LSACDDKPTRIEQLHAANFRLSVLRFEHLDLRERQVVDDRQMRETARSAGTPCHPARSFGKSIFGAPPKRRRR
jgi:hypothetical protein